MTKDCRIVILDKKNENVFEKTHKKCSETIKNVSEAYQMIKMQMADFVQKYTS